MAVLLIKRSDLSHSRLNVVQTEFGQNVSFEMRTFRFIIAGSSDTEAQNQTIACNLHLEPVDDVSSTQPDDCSCHTEADCRSQGFHSVYSVLNMANILVILLKSNLVSIHIIDPFELLNNLF